MGTGKKGVCIARGGSQKAGGRVCGHFKQSRVAGSAKQGSSTQGQCMASRWGKQGCRAATEGAGGCRILGKGGEKEGSVDGSWASCLPATPPGLLGMRIPGLLPTKPFRSPTLSSMELLPCIACVLGPTASERPPAASQPSPKAKDRGSHQAERGLLGLLEVKLREAGQRAAVYHLCHLKMGPSKGLDPKPYMGKLSIN